MHFCSNTKALVFTVACLTFMPTTSVYADQAWLTVTGASMQPLIEAGDKVKLDASAYLVNKPKKGDVVGMLGKGVGDKCRKRGR